VSKVGSILLSAIDKANKFRGVCKMYVKQLGNPSQEYWDIVYDILKDEGKIK
jgi:hypothetical protein